MTFEKPTQSSIDIISIITTKFFEYLDEKIHRFDNFLKIYQQK